MTLRPEQITIAITVYDRREFIAQAIESALGQTISVRVLVVEDCGPDHGFQAFIKAKFGSRLTYVRNPVRRGLFGNWNACIESCETPWLSILHDDDYFKPSFMETMLGLYEAAPERGLYFGTPALVDSKGQFASARNITGFWEEISVQALADTNFLGFAGHLFPIAAVKEVGGFRSTSRYCGDWEMWFKLTSKFGGARTGTQVVVVRDYDDSRKGTSMVSRVGKDQLATIVQRKRNYAQLKSAGRLQSWSAGEVRAKTNVTAKYLLWYGSSFSARMLQYNVRLFLSSRPLSLRQRLLQTAFRIFGSRFARWCSRLSHLT